MHIADRSDNYLPLLQQFAVFAELDTTAARYLAGGCTLARARRNQILCDKGQRLSGLHCLLSGSIKLAVLSAQGGERVLDILTPGRLFGQSAIMLDQPCVIFAEALLDTKLLVIDRERLQNASLEFPSVGKTLLQLVSEDVQRLVQDLESCCLMSARQRVVELLIREARPEGDSTDRADVVLPAAKGLVASRLNISAETFSRELRDLVQRGLIHLDRRTIRIPSVTRLHALRADQPRAEAIKAVA